MSSDQIFQEFKLYIEGVQVPFNSISINQSIGNFPTAIISIPPLGGLMDIARFYQPKVHIFFTERDTNTDKVLFTGIITGTNYSKSKEGNGYIGVTFNCIHRYNLITECLIDYTGAIRDGGTDTGGSNAAIALTDNMNSTASIIEALTGWTQVSTGATQDYSEQNPVGPVNENSGNNIVGISRADVLPSYLTNFANRLIGMPGVLVNYWNQLKRAGYNPFRGVGDYQGVFKHLYEPLIEDGLGFFKRLTGHMIIEKTLNGDRQQNCGASSDKSILIPPCNQGFFKSTVKANLTIKNLQTIFQNSNEVTNLYAIFQNYYNTLDYDIITLACPAEVVQDPDNKLGVSETYAVDTILKPSMPFYYSPTCNILYPSMYTSINTSYDEASMPTRLDVLNHEDSAQAGVPGTHFRTPASVRSAIAERNSSGDPVLENTMGSSRGAIGKYEMGRGIKYESSSMPDWLAILGVSTKLNKAGEPNPASPVETDTFGDSALGDLQLGWIARYGTGDAGMSPWNPASGILPHERILFSTADYYYTKKFASIKAGNVNCLFNPYIVPGYPMDIMEASPDLPSFHALCTSVGHNITANGVSTQVSFAAAMTYTELANYYIPFINPYLQVTLGLAINPTLVNNDANALRLANDFYLPTLGVNAVAPETIFNFNTGITNSVKISKGILVIDGKQLSDHSFEEDLLLLCKRPIESKIDFASRFDLTYIDMVPQNYTSTGLKYGDPALNTGNTTKFEIGQSQFLDYSQAVYDIINGITPPTT